MALFNFRCQRITRKAKVNKYIVMKIQKTIYPSFRLEYRDVLQEISRFNQIGSLLKDERNVVKVSNIKGIPVVIKYFKRISFFNRIIYGLFRKSKAQRAYENAGFLTNNGITTPLPVAFVDMLKHGLLQESYFISLYVDCKSSEGLFYLPLEQSSEALKAFAAFTYKLHKLGVFHADYSPGNVLYANSPEGYDFCLIDNNRIRFRNYSRKRALRNLRRINMPLDRYAVFAMEYARLEQSDAMNTAQRLLFYHQVRKKWVAVRKSIKRQLKCLIGFGRLTNATVVR